MAVLQAWLPEPTCRANAVHAHLWWAACETRGKQATIKINHSFTFSFCVRNVWNGLWKEIQKRNWGNSWTHFPPGLLPLHSSTLIFPPKRLRDRGVKVINEDPCILVHACALYEDAVICALTEEWQLPRLLILSVCQVLGLVGVTAAGISSTNGEIRRAHRGEERLV